MPMTAAQAFWRDKYLLAAAFLLLWRSRLILSAAGFGDPRAACRRHAAGPASPSALNPRIAETVEWCSRFVAAPTCLVKAMAGQRLLAMKGYGSEIHVGVRKTSKGRFEAHAWLVSGEAIVLGSRPDEAAQFSLLIGAS